MMISVTIGSKRDLVYFALNEEPIGCDVRVSVQRVWGKSFEYLVLLPANCVH